jgi:hypothetical protein
MQAQLLNNSSIRGSSTMATDGPVDVRHSISRLDNVRFLRILCNKQRLSTPTIENDGHFRYLPSSHP